MKSLITFLTVLLLTGSFLYPLFVSGMGKPVAWEVVAMMAAGGICCFYLLVKFRKSL